MNPNITKLIVTGVAVGIYVLTHFLPDLKELLVPVAAALIGGMWVQTPGTVNTSEPNTQTSIIRETTTNTIKDAPTEVTVVARDVTPPALPDPPAPA